MPARDDFTSTVDGAAAHAALFAEEPWDDTPSLDEVQDVGPRPVVELCRAHKIEGEGREATIAFCIRGKHQGGPHAPGVPMNLDLWRSWRASPPF